MTSLIRKIGSILIVCTMCFSFVGGGAILTAQAQVTSPYTLLEPLPCINGASGCTAGTQITQITDFGGYVQYIFNLAIALAAVAAVFMIVWGGLQYMSTDSFQGKKDGLKKLQDAIYGLLLILCSYLILRTIDPRLVNIPSTLVAPLTLNNLSSLNSSFFNSLISQAGNYSAQNQQLANADRQAQATVLAAQQNLTTLQTQLSDLCTQLDGVDETDCSGDPDPQVQALEAQISNANDNISTTEANAALAQAQTIMNAATGALVTSHDQSGAVSQITPQDISSAQAALDTEYANGTLALDQLDELNGSTPVTQVTALSDAYYSNSAKLDLVAVSLSSSGITSDSQAGIAKINQDFNGPDGYMSKLSAPAQAALQTQENQVIQTLQQNTNAQSQTINTVSALASPASTVANVVVNMLFGNSGN